MMAPFKKRQRACPGSAQQTIHLFVLGQTHPVSTPKVRFLGSGEEPTLCLGLPRETDNFTVLEPLLPSVQATRFLFLRRGYLY